MMCNLASAKSRFNYLSHFEYSIAPVATLCLKSTEGVGNAFCSATRPGSLDIQEFRQGKLLELRTRKTSRKGKRKKKVEPPGSKKALRHLASTTISAIYSNPSKPSAASLSKISLHFATTVQAWAWASWHPSFQIQSFELDSLGGAQLSFVSFKTYYKCYYSGDSLLFSCSIQRFSPKYFLRPA